MKIYKIKKLKQATIFQKLFKKTPTENCVIEINNLLAKNQDKIINITIDEIVEIADKYQVNLKRKFIEERQDLFCKYLLYCLRDRKLSNQEIETLRYIKDLLFLKDKNMQRMIDQETKKMYAKNVEKALADGRLQDFEIDNLDKLKKDLLLSDKTAEKIKKTNAKLTLQKLIDNTISNERLSQDEELGMQELARNLNVNLNIDQQTKSDFERYKLYWQIENGEIPILESDIKIQKSENLHFKTLVDWSEQRRVPKKINYHGLTGRFKIAKGIYYRMGSLNYNFEAEDEWRIIDSGNLYVTNKRIIFMGNKGNKTIRFNKILGFDTYKNGILIQKDTGKNPFLQFNSNQDILAIILGRLIDEA